MYDAGRTQVIPVPVFSHICDLHNALIREQTGEVGRQRDEAKRRLEAVLCTRCTGSGQLLTHASLVSLASETCFQCAGSGLTHPVIAALRLQSLEDRAKLVEAREKLVVAQQEAADAISQAAYLRSENENLSTESEERVQALLVKLDEANQTAFRAQELFIRVRGEMQEKIRELENSIRR